LLSIDDDGDVEVLVWLATFSNGISPLFKLAFVFVRLDHVARCFVNTNHGIGSRAEHERAELPVNSLEG
jgi:hypothetical protein